MSTLSQALVVAALLGDEIPAHDRVHDLAEEIGARLEGLHAYIAEVRDRDQADAALVEFADAIKSAVLTRVGQ